MPEPQSGAGLGPEHPREKPDRAVEGRPSLYVSLSALFVILTGVVGFHYATRGFQRYPVEAAPHVPAADAERGRALIRHYGCVGCHTIPGVPGATGRVGPRLDRLREQSFIAGVLPNSPQNLVVWIMRPREVDPRTAMPNLGVGEQDARDVAAYLLSLP